MISQEAADYLEDIATRYVAAGRPNHRAWFFDRKPEPVETNPVHDELLGENLIRRAGTQGAGFFFTDPGLAWIKNYTRAFNPRKPSGLDQMRSRSERDQDRFLVLMTLFRMAGGTQGDVDADDLRAKTGLDHDAFGAAEEYLTGEGLVGCETNETVHLTHPGVVEYEEAEKAAEAKDGDTEHFSQAVVQYVVNHQNVFHGSVGAYQSGDGSVATVYQQNGASPRELLELLSNVEEELKDESTAAAVATKGIVAVAKGELITASPNWEKVKGVLSPIAIFGKDIAKGVAIAALVAYLKAKQLLPP